MHLVGVLLDQATRQGVLLIDDAAHLGVDLLHGLFRDVGGLGHRAAQEDLAFVLGIDHGAQRLGHAIAHDHVTRYVRGTLEVVARAGGHLVHEHFLGDAATEQHGDLVQHVLLVVGVAVLLGQAHGHAQRTAARDDGDLVHRVALGQQLADERVARLVVGRIAALFLGHDHALALGAHDDLVLGLLEVLHLDHSRIAACSHQRGFVAQVGQIGTAHAGRAARDDGWVHVLAYGDLAHVHAQDLLAAPDVGQRHIHLAVKAPWAQQGGVQNVGAVGRCHHDHAQVGLEAVHLDEHLVQRLLALVVATAQACATLTAHGVDFVDEDDAGSVLLGVLEHVAYAGRAHADEHFHKVGTRDAEERYLGFARDGLGQQRLAGARRADQQQTARNASAKLLELARILEEVHDFLHFFLGFVAASDIGKGDGVVVLVQHARFALAEAESAALAAALHLAHEVHPHADEQQHGTPAHEQGHEQRAFLARLDVELDVVVDQVAHQAPVEVGGRGADAAVVLGDGHDLGTALPLLDGCALDTVVAHLFQELGIAQMTGRTDRTRVKLLEHGEQHHGNDQPYGNFRKPLIVQARLQ